MGSNPARSSAFSILFFLLCLSRVSSFLEEVLLTNFFIIKDAQLHSCGRTKLNNTEPKMSLCK